MNGKCGPVRQTLPPLLRQLTPHESSSDDDRSQCGDSTDSDGVFLVNSINNNKNVNVMLIKTTPT